MNISIPESQVAEFVSTAIMRHLDEATRQTLIEEALKYLITPRKTDGYGRTSPAPIQEAFTSAVQREASRYAAELFAADEGLKAKVHDFVRRVAGQVLSGDDTNPANEDTFATVIAAGIGKALGEATRKIKWGD